MAAGRQQLLDPCEAASFNEQACQAAIPSRGYCWNGRWVRLKTTFPTPIITKPIRSVLANGGVVNAAAVGSCVPPSRVVFGSHGAAYGGFGATGACYTRGVECTRQEFGVRPGQSAQHPEISTTLKAGGPVVRCRIDPPQIQKRVRWSGGCNSSYDATRSKWFPAVASKRRLPTPFLEYWRHSWFAIQGG